MSKQQEDKQPEEKKEYLAAKARRPGVNTDYYLQYFWNDEWNTRD